MNREERRRQEKANRQGGNRSRTIPADRLPAEVQDFTAGTIFAAGAASIHATGPGPDAPPLFVVLLDKANISPAPELVQLFDQLDAEGTVAVNAQIKGNARWAAMPAPDGQWLAKLELNLTEPMKTRPSFLLLADNYKQIWDIPASGDYVLGLTTTERFAALGPDSSYADALDACVLLPLPASTAAKELREHYNNPEKDASGAGTPTPPLVILNGGDDMRYQTGIRANPATGLPISAYMLMRPTGITQMPLGPDSVPTLAATSYAQRGLSWFDDPEALPVAEGWSWQLHGRYLAINDADGIMAASIELGTSAIEDQWAELIQSTGRLVLYVGDELATDDGRSTKDQLLHAAQRGNLVWGVVLADGSNDIPTAHDQPAAPTQPVGQKEAASRPWWKRLFRP